MGMFRKLRGSFVVAALFAAIIFAPRIAAAADAKCEPDKLATKYPGLVGKTLKVGTDAETPPLRDARPQELQSPHRP